ncbi:hypothetical protein NMY22_g895 [Coprinellus aureogranulatus]|nr:hypothetical protein NMY22_g895 [Coprinellus aureogranulatus]
MLPTQAPSSYFRDSRRRLASDGNSSKILPRSPLSAPLPPITVPGPECNPNAALPLPLRSFVKLDHPVPTNKQTVAVENVNIYQQRLMLLARGIHHQTIAYQDGRTQTNEDRTLRYEQAFVEPVYCRNTSREEGRGLQSMSSNGNEQIRLKSVKKEQPTSYHNITLASLRVQRSTARFLASESPTFLIE